MSDTTNTAGPGIYRAIAAVMHDIGQEGIAKGRDNKGQGFKFRGIDDIYNALNPILSRHGLCIIPRHQVRVCEERVTAKGGTMFYVNTDSEFDLVCADDGSVHTARAFGEAMDTADKATNKAMSAAYKYMAFQTFCIPTEGENDADARTPEPVRPRVSDRDRAQLVIWRSNTLDRIAKAENEADLIAIQKAGDFKRYAGMLDESGTAEIRKAFSDRRTDFEPPLDGKAE